ncbi:Rieske 2Fe-2S domain-containing protein [Leptolyngbya sp. 7M]|uniref:Rieske 2Fe-2S domain-containing protein n=1 Tax=Leptolyngbya sp. 7M TaxID=2812896 RepID=UPI0021F22F28|nr:Rieske 2Fe-2S domain-containing protein [Leptolyngbya sp. 7M]
MPLTHLADGTPQSFELLGQRIVLWLDTNGNPAAVADRCCHRSARLSLGQVVNGCIRCPYHGSNHRLLVANRRLVWCLELCHRSPIVRFR